MMVMFGKTFLQFDLEQEDGVLAEGPEDEDDAGDDPGLDGRQTFGLGRVCLDRVEDVDQHQEDRHQKGHPTWKAIKEYVNSKLRLHCTKREYLFLKFIGKT